MTDGKTEAVTLAVVDEQYVRLSGEGYHLQLASLGIDSEFIPVSEVDAVIRLIRSSGARVYVSGVGFEPGTLITVYLFSVPELVGHLPVGADGSFAGTLPIPTYLAPGQHTLQVNGIVAGGKGTRSVSAGLLLVDNKLQQIAFEAPKSLVYGMAPVTLQATADSGLPVSYSVSGVDGQATDIASFVNDNELHIHAAGTFLITASQDGDATYAPAVSVSHIVQVDRARLVVFADRKTKIYGASDPLLTYTHSGLVGADSERVFIGELAREAGDDVGVYGITQGNLAAGGNYDIIFTGAGLSITPAIRNLDFPVLPAKTFGDADFFTGATSSTGETISYTSSNPGVATVNGGTIRIMGAGTTALTATLADNGNYVNSPVVMQTLTVGKAEQAITLSASGQVNRDAGSVPVEATAGSGLPVSLSIDDAEVASLNGTTLHIHRLGTVRITATQAGDSNYHAAEAKTIAVRVSDPSADFPIRVSRAVSPNGDGINDYLIIEAIKDLPDNRVRIFNRNGTVIYEASGYNNGTIAFRGVGTGQHNVPAGTYFYLAEIKVDGQWTYDKGWFVLRY